MQFLPQLIAAMVMVESGGDARAVGDGGRAVGCLQIHAEVIADVNRIYKTCYVQEDLTDPEISKKICQMYLIAYAPPGATPEQCARIWNGGPRGHLKKSTETYWAKVRTTMDLGW